MDQEDAPPEVFLKWSKGEKLWSASQQHLRGWSTMYSCKQWFINYFSSFLGFWSQSSVICQVLAKQKQKQNRWFLRKKKKKDWTQKSELKPIVTPSSAGAKPLGKRVWRQQLSPCSFTLIFYLAGFICNLPLPLSSLLHFAAQVSTEGQFGRENARYSTVWYISLGNCEWSSHDYQTSENMQEHRSPDREW